MWITHTHTHTVIHVYIQSHPDHKVIGLCSQVIEKVLHFSSVQQINWKICSTKTQLPRDKILLVFVCLNVPPVHDLKGVFCIVTSAFPLCSILSLIFDI